MRIVACIQAVAAGNQGWWELMTELFVLNLVPCMDVGETVTAKVSRLADSDCVSMSV